MKSVTWRAAATIGLLILPAVGHAGNRAESEVVNIGSRRELFVDRFLIDSLSNTQLRLNDPREENVAIRFDLPHEGPFAGYTTVIQDGGLYRMYYRGVAKLERDGSSHERTCYAESTDGITWTKPELGLYEFNGTKKNNIVLADVAPVTHNFCPMLDTNPNGDPQERYKGIGGTGKELHAFVSPDGLHWKRMQDGPLLASADIPIPHRHLFDSQNLAFWSESEQCYVLYFRIWDGIRKIARTTSRDFRTWTPAVMMQQLHDDGVHGPQPAPPEQLYTNQTSAYFRAPHIYVATAARFFPKRQVVSDEQAAALNVNPKYYKDTSDFVFMSSRGGDVYDRTFLQGYVKPGIGLNNWVSRANYPALNIVQTSPTHMSFYVNKDYAQSTSFLRRYTLRLDGFASLHAGATTGEVITRPLTFQGSRLNLNFATSAGGSVQVEIQDVNGSPLPGFAAEDCPEIIGNEISRQVRWTDNSNLSKLSGQPVRLRFILKDADVYAMQFAE